MRRILLLLGIVSLIFMYNTSCYASGVPELTARSAIVTDENGTVLYEKDSTLRLPPASVTKIMTLLLAVEAVESGVITADEMITASMPASKEGGSQIWLEPNEQMSAYDMMTAIAVVSANDAAYAVMERIYGSESAAVEAMNRRAEELGLTDTHFANVNGLPVENHYMSVRDVSVLVREAVKHPLYLELCGKKEVWLRGGKNWLVNTNKLLWWYAGADGMKTGWTEEAKYCFAGTAVRDGLRLVSVVFGAEEPRSHLRESMALLDWGYRNYQYEKIAEAGDIVGAVAVRNGEEATVDLVASEPIGYLEKRGKEKRNIERIMPTDIVAPTSAGEICGKMILREDGVDIISIDLMAGKSIGKIGFWQIVKRNAVRMVTWEASL